MITKEKLKELYIAKRLSIRQIAKTFNCAPSTIWTKFCQFNIGTRTKSEANKRKYRIKIPRELLQYLYVNKKLDTDGIAKKFKCSAYTIIRRLHYYNIPIERLRINIPPDELKYLYLHKNMTIYQIAPKFNCNPVTILNRLNYCNIPIRKKGKVREEDREIEIPKDKLKYLYIDKELTIAEIVKISNWSRGTVYKRLRRYDLVRSVSEALRGKPSTFKGKHHTLETKKKLSMLTVKQLASGKMKRQDTMIEQKIEEGLKKNNIYYKKYTPLCNITVADFYLPEFNLVIYTDGDYWHNLPLVKNRDEKQNIILKQNGYQVLRFWEHEVNKSVDDCIGRIKEQISSINLI